MINKSNPIDNQSILITGGTGSFSKKFIETIYNNYKPKKIIIYSRDELKQFKMSQIWPQNSVFRYFIGDVRDFERLKMAMENVDIVIHTAALKQVPAAEYNPFEVIKTNIIGAQNVINAAMQNNVKRIIALSTDKAAAPVNLYGATKLCSDKLFVAANNYKGKRDIKFSVVRYGNVMGSRGSVIPSFLEHKKHGFLPITDTRMTRFNITLTQAVNFVIDCLDKMWGGEIFVPKIPSYRILDLAKAIAPECQIKTIGIRPGEKLHEEMITHIDSLNTIEFSKYYVIAPTIPLWDKETFKRESSEEIGHNCEENFSYNSNNNPHFLTVDELRYLINTELKNNTLYE